MISENFLIEKILNIKQEEGGSRREMNDGKEGKQHKDAVVTTIHGMAKDFTVPMSVYPWAPKKVEDVYDVYTGYERIRSVDNEIMRTNKSFSAIHFPDRPEVVCQCVDCCFRVRYFQYPERSYISQRSYTPEDEEENYTSSPSKNIPPLTPLSPSSEVEIVDVEIPDSPLSSSSTPLSNNDVVYFHPVDVSSEKFSPQPKESSNGKQQSKKYICKVCDRDFTWFGNYQKHVLKHGKIAENDYFFTEDNLCEETIISKNATNTYRCKLCDKTFSRLSGLRTHIRMHNGLRPFKCMECSLAFTTNRALKMHSRIHSGERPYKCPQCEKSFTRKDELQAHTYLHKGEKPYKCQVCSSAFVRQGHLQRHMLTHAPEKPYKCKICPKSFTQYRNLQTHIYKHTGERPYKCQFCGKGFTQQGTVQAHERTHTGNKPYACDHCEKRFITSSHLRWHVKKHHVTAPKDESKISADVNVAL